MLLEKSEPSKALNLRALPLDDLYQTNIVYLIG